MSLTIRNKLTIAIFVQLVFILLICFFLFFLNRSFNQIYRSKVKNTEELNNIKAFTLSIKDYFNQNIEYSSITTAYEQLESEIEDVELNNKINEVWTLLQDIEKQRINNKRIEKNLFSLSNEAIDQSSTFIKKMSQQLADETARHNVSTLERQVISGANINSNFYSKVKELFLKLTQDVSLENDLLKLLESGIENTKTDIERLKNTPYAHLPQNAFKAEMEIREMATGYVANVKVINDDAVVKSSDRLLVKKSAW